MSFLYFFLCLFCLCDIVILTSYDFDGTQQLSVDEVTLALKSAATGVCKLYNKKFPREELIEQLVTEVFRHVGGITATELSLFRISVLTENLTMHPDILCWYNAFGEPPQRDLQKHNVIFTEVDFQKENLVRLSFCNCCLLFIVVL